MFRFYGDYDEEGSNDEYDSSSDSDIVEVEQGQPGQPPAGTPDLVCFAPGCEEHFESERDFMEHMHSHAWKRVKQRRKKIRKRIEAEKAGTGIPEQYVNCDLDPRAVTDYQFLWERNAEQMRKYPYGGACGKWMQFWDKKVLNEKWTQARQLYREGKLEGIHSMKVPTAYDDGQYSKEQSPIIFYCGSAHDKKKMMQIGENLLQQLPYYNRDPGFMYYKSDEQTIQGHSRRNHLYKIAVPSAPGEEVPQPAKKRARNY